MKHYTFTFTVQQRGANGLSFPVDMMRRDRCTPDSESDSYAIQRTMDMGGGNHVGAIKMRAETENRHWEPTAGRWDSFGWEVIPNSLQRKDY